MLNNLRSQSSLLGKTHISSKGAVWDPLRGVSWRSLLKHTIDLLKRKSLGLRDEEVGVNEADSAERAPDEEHLRTKVALVLADHVGGNDRDDAVPEPVRGGRETDTTGSNRDREDFTDDNPSTWSPGGSEEEDVDADEGDEGTGSVRIVGKGGSDGTDDELADDHAESAPDKDGAATETLDSPEGDGGGADVHDGEDQGHEEGVLDCVERLEEDGRVVEDEVDTRPLLHHSGKIC